MRHRPQPGVRDSEGRKIPKKYLHGLSKEKQKQMKKEIKDFRDRPDDDSEAYEPWVADKGVKPKKKSKATTLYHRMFGEDVIYENSDSGLAKKAAQSGIPLSILRQVFKRGMAAWKTGHRPGVAQQQWAYGRVNSFITGSGGARKADADLWEKAKKSKKQEEAVDLNRTPLLAEDACAGRKPNQPWRTPGGPKKFAVCASEGGKTRLVRFGDPGLEIKRDSDERRKNFRARHGCGKRPNTLTKLKAGYWACKTWEKGRSVGDVVGEALAESDREERETARAVHRGDVQATEKLRRQHARRLLDVPVSAPEGAVVPRTIRYAVQHHPDDRSITREPPLASGETQVVSRQGRLPYERSTLHYSSTVGEKADKLRDVHQDIKNMGRVSTTILRPGERGTQKRLGEPKWERTPRPDKRGVLVQRRAMVARPATRTARAIEKLRQTRG